LINDTYGHNAGDAVLVAVADRLRTVLRAGDIIGRWGGDELVILVRDSSADDLRLLLARTRAAIAEPIPFGEHALAIGVAIGAANFPEDGATAEALFHVADERMYRDKQANKANAAQLMARREK
jgi:diguanylate cyclase (GGDEF)-like protein